MKAVGGFTIFACLLAFGIPVVPGEDLHCLLLPPMEVRIGLVGIDRQEGSRATFIVEI